MPLTGPKLKPLLWRPHLRRHRVSQRKVLKGTNLTLKVPKERVGIRDLDYGGAPKCDKFLCFTAKAAPVRPKRSEPVGAAPLDSSPESDIPSCRPSADEKAKLIKNTVQKILQ